MVLFVQLSPSVALYSATNAALSVATATSSVPQGSRPRSEKSLFSTFRKPSGTHPLSWLEPRISPVRFVRLPNSGGIKPLNWLRARDSHVRFVRLPNSAGIEPLNWLWERLSFVTRPLSSVVTPCH